MSFLESRRFQLAIVLAAPLLWILGVGMLIFAAITNPSPWRAMSEVVDGKPGTGAFACGASGFVVGDSVYRICNSSGGNRTMRLDLARGVAETFGPLRQHFGDAMAMGDWQGFASDAQNGTAVFIETDRSPGWDVPTDIDKKWGSKPMFRMEDQYEIWRPDGTRVELGLPAGVTDGGMFDRLAGLAWNGNQLEMVLETDANKKARPLQASDSLITFYRYQDGWSQGETITRPTECNDCKFVMAWREADGWRYLFSPAQADASTKPTVIMVNDKGVASPALVDSNAPKPIFDTSITNVTRRYSANVTEASPLLGYQNGRWQLMVGEPAVRNSFNSIWETASSYYLRNGRLNLIFHETADKLPSFDSNYTPKAVDLFYINGRWLELKQENGNLTLGESGKNNAVLLQRVDALGQADVNWRPLAMMAPASDGGYWLLSGRGGYLHLNDQFQRTDPLTLPERFSRVFDNFRLLGENAGEVWYYQQVPILKKAAFLVVLLGLPVLFLLVLLRYRRGVNVEKLFSPSVLYLILALLSFPWFLHLVAIF